MSTQRNDAPRLAVIDIESNAPIAAMNGEPPHLILLEIGRDKIESTDTRVVLHRLRQLTADRDTVIGGKGRLSVLAGGYDNDPRALVQVAEYGTFIHTVMQAWPYFGWFCTLDVDLPDDLINMMDLSTRPNSAFLNILLADACTHETAPNKQAAPSQQTGWSAIVLDRDRMGTNVQCLFNGLFELAHRHNIPLPSVHARISAIEQLLEDRGIN